MIDPELLDEEALEAKRRDDRSRRRDVRQHDLRSLLQTEWGRRQWWQHDVGPDLLSPHIANDTQRCVLRDRAVDKWHEAMQLFPDLVLRAMQEQHDRAND